jgi:hypothetical protein
MPEFRSMLLYPTPDLMLLVPTLGLWTLGRHRTVVLRLRIVIKTP